MDSSKINQTELSYSCGAGEAKVNLFTGRLLFAHPDISMGIKSHQIELTHIYNSQLELPSHLNSFTGNGWKLNVQQYLFLDRETYVYIDGLGYRHEFASLNDSDKYYDTTGLGLTLSVGTDTNEIKDESGNTMIFEDDRLIKSISCIDTLIAKHFDYDSAGRLISVYDRRKPDTKFVFSYDEISGLLKTIICNKGSTLVEKINYFYNYENHLIRMERAVDGITKIDSLFSYNVYLEQVTYFEDKSTIIFDYDSEKIILVKTGIATISVDQNMKSLLCVGDELFCGEELYIGEKYIDEKYYNNYGAAILGVDQSSKYKIEYKPSYNPIYTIVTNVVSELKEKNIMMVYYFNQKGFTTSIFEAYDGFIDDLRTLEKLPGVSMIGNGSRPYMINGKQPYTYSSSDIISISEQLDKIKDYRKLKCPNYINYICRFFLKLERKMSSTKVEVKVDNISVGVGTFDNSAINSWQQVFIPIVITNDSFNSFDIKFLDNLDKNFEIADMSLYYAPTSKFYITKNVDDVNYENINKKLLNDFTKIKYNTPSKTNVERIITDDFYLTGADIQLTYLSLFKEKIIAGKESFVFSCCNNTEKILATSLVLCIIDNEFLFGLEYDKSQIISRAQFISETRSPDGNIFTNDFIYFYKNKIINGRGYNCLCQITKVNQYPESHSEHKESQMETNVDLKGKVLNEIDEYGVETIYSYDGSGFQNKKTIQNIDKTEKLEFDLSNGDFYTIGTDYKSRVRTNYDNPIGNVTSLEYNGKYESANNILKTSFTYDRFNNNLLSIKNNIGGSNYIKYGGGRLIEANPIEWNENNAYGYKIGYSALGDPINYYLTYKSSNLKKEDLLISRDIDRLNNKITTFLYRNSEPDKSIIQLDKYGQTTSIEEGSKKTTFTTDYIIDKGITKKEIEKYDPFEDSRYVYHYDDFNNISSYNVKDSSENNLLAIEPIGNNKTSYKYKGYGNERSFETGLQHHNDKLLNPRIEQTNTFSDILNYTTSYKYDSFGRINEKKYDVRDADLLRKGRVTETITYKPNTLLLDNIKTKVEFTERDEHIYDLDYNFYNIYDDRCNITTKGLTQISNGQAVYQDAYRYTYDIANRLTSEHNPNTSITKEYTYNLDGTVNTENNGTIKLTYGYNKGRLSYYHDDTPIGHTQYFAYDNLGNCTHYMRLSTASPNMEWERGNLLKKYIGISTTTYSYNSNGIRYKKESSGETTTYHYDGEKLLGENWGELNEIKYLYDIDGIKGFKLISNKIYNYIKDLTGNVISIIDGGEEVAHYEYDAWGKCTITENIGGIATLNPFRWKSQYYDNESGLYYMGGRYYSPAMKNFISPCNIDEILYNINVPGNLNPYSIGNPMYFPINRNNIFTSIPLTWDPPALTKWQNFWQEAFGWYNNLHWGWKTGIGTVAFAGAVGLTIFSGGTLAPVFIGMGVSVGAGALISGGITAATGGNFWEGALEGAIDGYMWGGIFAFGSSAIGAIKYTRGFRVVGFDEFDDIARTGQFLNARATADGKYFWASKANAKLFAQNMNMADDTYRIIGARISRSTFKSAVSNGTAFYWSTANILDDIGRAYFMHSSVVNEIIRRIWIAL